MITTTKTKEVLPNLENTITIKIPDVNLKSYPYRLGNYQGSNSKHQSKRVVNKNKFTNN